ncbi:hypothetical protein [Xanthomonas albilineans]|uniref:Uncharacterized protein n=1 Tax=Xanthomonas albilineans (strain GPE PC73 / CFBP 7063) TaxID=380358 RepID=D2U8S1_XANAP|nr:hypothetical protein [Xanthomonas albilineans]CBA14727.1 hypothetical protein XALC_0181 [Xanthomonas albilineans GPE PC73]
MSAPVDVVAVLDSQIAEFHASGDTGNVENLVWARDAFATLIAEARKIEHSIHLFGMTCEEFSTSIKNCVGQP